MVKLNLGLAAAALESVPTTGCLKDLAVHKHGIPYRSPVVAVSAVVAVVVVAVVVVVVAVVVDVALNEACRMLLLLLPLPLSVLLCHHRAPCLSLAGTRPSPLAEVGLLGRDVWDEGVWLPPQENPCANRVR